MTFLHKLSNRLARLKAPLILSLAVLSCERPLGIDASSSALTRIAVSPRDVTLFPNQTTDIMAVGFTAAGDTAMGISVNWSVMGGGGTIIDTSTSSGRHYGRYKSGTQLGKYKVVATSSSISDTAAVTVTQVPVATVAVTPAAASVTVGQTVQLTATPKDASGNSLSGRVVTWVSSNSGIASVNGGLVAGVAAGSATITATSEGQSGTAVVTVTSVPVASVTVSPATASIMVGQAVQLTATPKGANGNVLTGRVVTWASNNGGGATVNGTGLVTALAAGTAIITAACESATGTTTVTVTNVPVASVTVSPPTASLTLGQTVQLTATPRDASGNPLTGRVVAWTSNGAAVATVNGNGLVTGLGAGTATITAASEGKSGTAAITVAPPPPPPPGGAWPNDPLAVGTPGWTLLTDYDMSAPLPVGGDQPIPGGQGWKIAGNGPPNTTAAWLISDPGAPLSPSVYAFQYSAGMAMGSAPATIYYDGFSTSEAYVGYWWKPSSNFFIGPVGTKITFMFNYGGSGGAYLIFHPGNVVEMSTFGQSTGYLNWDANVTATPVTLGQWHRIEWYLKIGVGTGIARWWLDGVLQGSYTNVTLDNAFMAFQFSPTFGGVGPPPKPADDWFYFDHVHISRR